jgi:GT2 family glycosyltransferase
MTLPTLGVVIVTFNAADVILDCVESLLAATAVRLEIVLVDNASSDRTLATLRAWASGEKDYVPPSDAPFAMAARSGPVTLLSPDATVPAGPDHVITLIEAKVNGGFAAGVNRGLAHLATRPGMDRFWVLNPDSVVPPGTPQAFATHPAPAESFAMMGGRVIYYDTPDIIQIDGGTINRRTGVTGNIGLGQKIDLPVPDPSTIDFITGASLVVSRLFYETVGPMTESYFLYYEEVDWALRRGALPLLYCPGGIVYHRAGTAIGSPTLGRPASPFSLYFKHRARLRFMHHFYPKNVPVALAYSVAKAAQLALKGYGTEARTVMLASLNRPPPPAVRAKLSDAAADLAFGPDGKQD